MYAVNRQNYLMSGMIRKQCRRNRMWYNSGY